jgi:hypothetical protein
MVIRINLLQIWVSFSGEVQQSCRQIKWPFWGGREPGNLAQTGLDYLAVSFEKTAPIGQRKDALSFEGIFRLQTPRARH